ncbi:MAG: hypothetical protein WC071_14220 [Victivallaceae bacterium]
MPISVPLLTSKRSAYLRLNLNRTPPDEDDYVRVKFRYNTGGKSYIHLPFDRFYMNEKLAQETENAVKFNSNSQKQVVRLKSGY